MEFNPSRELQTVSIETAVTTIAADEATSHLFSGIDANFLL
jgi:hypothetical protein